MRRVSLLLALALATASCAGSPATRVETWASPSSAGASVRTEVPGGSVSVSGSPHGVRVILDQRGGP